MDDIPVYLQDEDFLESNVKTATLRVGYEMAPGMRLVNLSRYGTTDNGYLMTGARGATVHATEADAEAGTIPTRARASATTCGAGRTWSTSATSEPAQRVGDGGIDHEFVLGLEYTDQSVLNGVYDYEATGDPNCWRIFRGSVRPSYCIYDENGDTVDGLRDLVRRHFRRGESDSDWNVETIAVSLMDTIQLTDQWSIFGGVRYDYYDYETRANFDPDGRGGPLPSEPTVFSDSEGFWNGHAGIVWSFVPEANIYASFSSATNINGGESDVGTSCGYGGICVAGEDRNLGDPEQTRNFEVGAKWNPLGGKLLATAAVFQITKDDVFESASGDSYSVLGTLNTGKNRVEGIELGLAGNLTDELSAHAGFTVMRSEILESVNPDNEGKPLANFANKSASLQLKYQMTPEFSFGSAVTYEDDRHTGQPDTAGNEAMTIPEYAVLDLFATYAFHENLKARLNVSNVTDEDYYVAAYRSGAFAFIGDARSVRLSLQAQF